MPTDEWKQQFPPPSPFAASIDKLSVIIISTRCERSKCRNPTFSGIRGSSKCQYLFLKRAICRKKSFFSFTEWERRKCSEENFFPLLHLHRVVVGSENVRLRLHVDRDRFERPSRASLCRWQIKRLRGRLHERERRLFVAFFVRLLAV